MPTGEKEMRLMIADDDPLFRRGVRQLVGYVDNMSFVAEASDGAHAVQVANRHRPDVILMDYEMPEMDGVAAARAILANQPHVKVICVSSNIDEATSNAMIRAGALTCFAKSDGPQKLMELLRSL